MIRAMQAKRSNPSTLTTTDWKNVDLVAFVKKIKHWGQELGFDELGIAGADVSAAIPELLRWLELGHHGEMDYMAKHAALRAHPESLVPGTASVITARLPYWPSATESAQVLGND